MPITISQRRTENNFTFVASFICEQQSEDGDPIHGEIVFFNGSPLLPRNYFSHAYDCVLEADRRVVEDVAAWLCISLIDHDEGPCLGSSEAYTHVLHLAVHPANECRST